MQKFPILFLLITLFKLSYAQNISTVYQLDTIIDTKIEADYSQFYSWDYISKILNNKLYTYIPSYSKGDTFDLLQIDLKSFTQKKIQFTIPSAEFKTTSPVIDDIAINNNYLVLAFSTKSFAVLKNNNDNFTFLSFTPLSEKFEYVYLLDSNKIAFCHLYNSTRLTNQDPSSMYIYSIKNEKVLNEIIPHFDGIEFSHLTPFHLITAFNNKIYFSQTIKYDINVFNSSLKEIGHIHSNEKWLIADTLLLKSYKHVKPTLSPKKLIDLITPISDTASRVESIYALNDSELLIRKIPPYSKVQNQKRLIDIWVNRKGEWQSEHQNLLDTIPPQSTILIRKNYPLMSQYDNSFFYNKYFIKMYMSFLPPQFGLTVLAEHELEEKQVGISKPTYKVAIYKK